MFYSSSLFYFIFFTLINSLLCFSAFLSICFSSLYRVLLYPPFQISLSLFTSFSPFLSRSSLFVFFRVFGPSLLQCWFFVFWLFLFFWFRGFYLPISLWFSLVSYHCICLSFVLGILAFLYYDFRVLALMPCSSQLGVNEMQWKVPVTVKFKITMTGAQIFLRELRENLKESLELEIRKHKIRLRKFGTHILN